jgi:tetratricopeptide (TPR) repeat protein
VIRALLIFALASLPARADETVLVRARAHFEAGRALYTLGRYEEALPEFVAGYQLFPRAEFLLDIAQCHRRLGHVAQARTMYQQFLVEAQAGDPHIPEARRLLAELPPSPPSPPPAPAPSPEVQQQVVTVAPPLRRSFWRRHWWILPTAGVVLAGVGVGIYFGTRPAPSVNCGAVGLGCVDARGP